MYLIRSDCLIDYNYNFYHGNIDYYFVKEKEKNFHYTIILFRSWMKIGMRQMENVLL